MELKKMMTKILVNLYKDDLEKNLIFNVNECYHLVQEQNLINVL